jgi:molecular chaperone DnaK
VNVGAKDKATGKDQSMTVASSSGLSDKDIERMVDDAEKFADEDKARKDVIEMANKADSFCADTDKGTLPVFWSTNKALINPLPSHVRACCST